jgi:general secretion pathway protein M
MNIKEIVMQSFQKIQTPGIAFWKKRQKREQYVILAGFSFVILLIFYTGIWSPLMTYQSRVIQNYENFQRYLPYIARTLAAYQELKQSHQIPNTVSTQPLQSQISDMLVQQQLVPFGLEISSPSPSLAVLSFKQAPFDALMSGVQSLSKRGIFIVQAQIQDVNKKGIVQGSLTFSPFK